MSYDGPIIDSHFHLWDLAADKHPWLRPSGSFGPPGRYDALKEASYLLDDYRADVAGQHVVAAVHIEAPWDPDDGQENETYWLDTLDKTDNLAVRYVAGVRFGRPSTAETIRRHLRSPRVVGVRQAIAWTPDPNRRMVDDGGLTRRPEWRAALPLLEEHDLLLELLMYPDQAADVAELAADHPRLQVVVDHLGSPVDPSDDGFRAWTAGLRTMAARPNVAIKLSSAAGYLPRRDEENLRRYAAEVLAAFTPDRVMVGSDFPVARLDGWNYARYMDAYRACVAGLGRREQEAVFFTNAARCYRIDPATVR